MLRFISAASFAVALGGGCGGGSGEDAGIDSATLDAGPADAGIELVTDVATLEARLTSAASRDVIHLAAGRFEGSFVVPAGVSLIGAGAGSTVVVSPTGASGLTLTPGTESSPTSVAQLSVVSGGKWSIIARGAGAVAIVGVDVDVPANGAGIGLEDLTFATLTDVGITGSVTAANVDALPLDPTADNSARDGLVLVRVSSARLTRVDVSGFAVFGVELVTSAVTWTQGNVAANAGTGLLVSGGLAQLDQITVSGTLQTPDIIPAFNAAFVNSAFVRTTGVTIADSEGYGALHVDVTAEHSGLVGRANNDPALWIQGAPRVVLTDITLEDNGLSGLVAFDVGQLTLDGGVIRGTRLSSTASGTFGDGLQLVRSSDGLSVRDLSLMNNARIGVLLDLGGGTLAAGHFESVAVDGSGTQNGAWGQNGTMDPAWDSGIQRLGSTLTNDGSLTGSIDITNVVAPTGIVDSDAVTGGLDGVVAPTG